MFVEIEGIDGCGKDTHGEMLAARLGAKIFRFPDRTTPIGKVIDDFLKGEAWVDVSQSGTEELLASRQAMTLQGLMLANRAELANDVRFAALKGNVVAIRYWGSGYAYGRSDGLDGDYLKKIHAFLPQPDLKILLNITVAESFARRPKNREAYENNHRRLERAKKFYEELWNEGRIENPIKWVTVDGSGTKEETAAAIEKAVADLRSVTSSAQS